MMDFLAILQTSMLLTKQTSPQSSENGSELFYKTAKLIRDLLMEIRALLVDCPTNDESVVETAPNYKSSHTPPSISMSNNRIAYKITSSVR